MLMLIWSEILDRLFIGWSWDWSVAEGLILSINLQQEHQTGNKSVTFQKRTIQSSDQTDYPCVHLVIW